jgi:DNA-3-methyladenine glycosylase
VLDVAQGLLGKVFQITLEEQVLAARIVETEAYQSDIDEASHAYRGRTPRNAPMFGPPAHLYVYRSYGIHYCVNVVTTHAGGPASAVLLRAMEAISGVNVMAARRRGADRHALLRGPGNVCRALGIDLSYSGRDLLSGNPTIRDAPEPSQTVVTATRIGISRCVEFPWRFYLRGNPAVSRRNRLAEAATRP